MNINDWKIGIEKRLTRIEAVVWTVAGMLGVKAGSDLLPIVTAVMHG